jgi:hypothetical protein
MKKFTYAILCLIIVLGLVACGGGDGNTQEDKTTTAAETGDVSLSIETQLILGTMKLDGTDLEVTADQASELLTLWKAFKSLSTSDTAAEEELDAVINQIQKTMTAEQLDAIQAMDLEQGDMASLMEELGILPEGGFMGGQGGGLEGQELPEGFTPGEIPEGFEPPEGFTPGERPEEGFQGGERPEGGFQGGEGPGGGFQGGEGMGGQGFRQEMDPEQIATLQAERGDRVNLRNRTSLFLIDPLLQYLEGKVE